MLMKNLNDLQTKENQRRRRSIAIPMGVGVVLGIVLGAAMGKVGLGLTIGIIIGGIGVAINRQRMLKDLKSNTAS